MIWLSGREHRRATCGDIHQAVWQSASLYIQLFDRVVINGYLSRLSRLGQVVHLFHDVVGEPVIGKEVLSRRTNEYQPWVEAFACNQTPIEWAEPKMRKEDDVSPTQRRMERAGRHGMHFILTSMEQGQTFRSEVPRLATPLKPL
jgi:hypothetical protein